MIPPLARTFSSPGSPPGRAEPPPPKGDLKPGAVLAFSLVLLALVCLTGVALLAGARAQIAIAERGRVYEETFNMADSTAGLALALTRFLAVESHRFEEFLNSEEGWSGPFLIDMNRQLLSNERLRPSPDRFDSRSRYLEALEWEGHKPQLIVKSGDKVVAAASIRHENGIPLGAGYSLMDGDHYDSVNGQGFELNIVVTAVGYPSVPDPRGPGEPRTVITAIYREHVF